MKANKNYKESGEIGEIFGVTLRYPITRAEIRSLVKSEKELAEKMSESEDLSIYQAYNDLRDEMTVFLENLDLDDRVTILNLMMEEVNAVADDLNAKALRVQQENVLNEVKSEQDASTIIITLIIGAVFIYLLLMR